MSINVVDQASAEAWLLSNTQWKYVCPFSWSIPTPYGDVHVPYGWLSDGATGVPDLCPQAFFAHDRLYTCPTIGERRLTRFQCDRVYARLLLRHWRPQVLWRLPGLLLFGGRHWRKARTREESGTDYWQDNLLPHAYMWRLPGFELSRATWRGYPESHEALTFAR